MPYSNSVWEAQLDRTLRTRYSTSFMNNTKWREVWQILVDLQLRVQMDYADDPGWSGFKTLWGPFTTDYIEERGIRDPGIGGPFLFKQILYLRVPKIWPNDVNAFMAAISSLGLIPLVESDDFVEIKGYDFDAG